MSETTEKIIISLLSLAIGSVCTYFGAVLIAKKNRRLDANYRLYEAFRKILWELERKADIEIDRLVLSDLGEQTAAVHKFKFFLPKFRFFFLSGERKCFIAAWDEYCKKCNEHKFADNGEINKRDAKRQNAIDCIYKILKFADYQRHD